MAKRGNSSGTFLCAFAVQATDCDRLRDMPKKKSAKRKTRPKARPKKASARKKPAPRKKARRIKRPTVVEPPAQIHQAVGSEVGSKSKTELEIPDEVTEHGGEV